MTLALTLTLTLTITLTLTLTQVHAAAELGPLPRYKTRRAYNAHIDAAPLVHLSG